MNYLQPLSNDRRKVRASDPRRAFRGLKSEPVGLVYGNTTRIDPGMNNVVRHALLTGTATTPNGSSKDVGRSIAPWSDHTTTGEDASRTASQHWAISQESVDPRRISTEQFMLTHPGMSYRTARNYVIAAELAAQRLAATKARKASNRRNAKLTAKVTAHLG